MEINDINPPPVIQDAFFNVGYSFAGRSADSSPFVRSSKNLSSLEAEKNLLDCERAFLVTSAMIGMRLREANLNSALGPLGPRITSYQYIIDTAQTGIKYFA